MSWHVEITEDTDGWEAAILEDGTRVLTRRCGNVEEAETFASVVRQHLRWLSDERFRAYYRL